MYMSGLIGYKNVTEDIQKYVKKIHENGFCNVRFHFEIALSKNRTSFLHACGGKSAVLLMASALTFNDNSKM